MNIDWVGVVVRWAEGGGHVREEGGEKVGEGNERERLKEEKERKRDRRRARWVSESEDE